MIDEILDDADERMGKSITNLQRTFTRIRSGRAHPSLLDSIEIEYFGVETPLAHLSTISVEEGRTLVIKPFEKSTLKDIEKQIFASNLGLTPNNNGEVVRLALPPLTEENRRDLIKQARNEAEQARVAVRNIRREAIHDIRELVQEKLTSQDDGHIGEEEVQEVTDKRIKEVEEVLKEKEADLMNF